MTGLLTLLLPEGKQQQFRAFGVALSPGYIQFKKTQAGATIYTNVPYVFEMD